MSTYYKSISDFIESNKLSRKLHKIISAVPTKTEDDLEPTSRKFNIVLDNLGLKHSIDPQHKKDLIAWLKLTNKLFL